MQPSGGWSNVAVWPSNPHFAHKATIRCAHLSLKTFQEAANAGSVIVPRVEAKAA